MCGYNQAEDDDFNWEQVNTLTKPTSDPWMPSGLLLVLRVFLFVFIFCVVVFLNQMFTRVLITVNIHCVLVE